MKTLISFYGGKQRMASKIIPYIPQHTIYVEPFCGGATLLFKKPVYYTNNNDHYREVINDIDNQLITMYKVAKLQPNEFYKLIDATLYSQESHKKAKDIVYNRIDYIPTELEIAWATFINYEMSFCHVKNGGWATCNYGVNPVSKHNNKIDTLKQILTKLEQVFISCEYAIKCIKRWDSPQTFFYCDPPYPNTDQGGYSGYTLDNLYELVDTLKNIQGSMILSCYNQPNMPSDWDKIEFNATMSASKDKTIKKERIECIWIKQASVTPRPEILKIYEKQKLLNNTQDEVR